MSARINLVNQKNPNKDKQERLRKIKGIAYSVLAVAALIVIIIFALEYRFSASYVKNQQTELLNELDQYSEKSAKFFLINSNLTEIGRLISQRKNYHKNTSEIFNLKPSDVNVIEYNYKDNLIEFTANSPSIGSIDTFLNSLIELQKKKVINSVALKSLAIEGDNYSITLVIL